MLVLGLAAPLGWPSVPPTADATNDPSPWTLPTRPPNCSSEQALSGDVAECIVSASGGPARRGFGVAPNPSSTPGFSFNGWSYGGPGVDRFAEEFVTTNVDPVAGRGPGSLRTHVAAAALFEGFLDEIHRGGYPVQDMNGFVYRCTSGSAGNCAAGSMSNHAWGLAVDINAGRNPERTYVADGDTSACAVPQQTDIPRWVVETAERWGLFWGGYGWRSGGCDSPDDWSDRIRRDPHHFEFRGTVDMALAIARHNGRSPHPMYCTTIVNDRRDEVTACNRTGVPSAGSRSPVPVEAPRGATGVILTVTAVGAAEPGFLTAEPCAVDLDAPRTTSNTNFVPGTASANTAIVPLDRHGRTCIWRSAATHTLVDVVGFLVPRSSDGALGLVSVDHRRVADTRAGGGMAPYGTHAFALDAPDGALVNVTAVDAASTGFVTADRCSAFGAHQPATSTVNHPAGDARANLTFVTTDTAPGSAGFGPADHDRAAPASCVWSSVSADVLVDVVARLDPDGAGIEPVAGTRALDTRSCPTADCTPVPAHSVVEVPGTDGGVIANVTVTGARAPGFVSAVACDELAPGAAPSTSTVNVGAGDTLANLAVVASGRMCLYASTDAHLIVDVQARLGDPTAGAGIRLTDPTRRLDTRG